MDDVLHTAKVPEVSVGGLSRAWTNGSDGLVADGLSRISTNDDDGKP